MQGNTERIIVPSNIFEKLIGVFGEFKYNQISTLLTQLQNTTKVVDNGMDVDLGLIRQVCTVIAENMTYAKCANILIEMEKLFLTDQHAKHAKQSGEATVTSINEGQVNTKDPEPEQGLESAEVIEEKAGES